MGIYGDPHNAGSTSLEYLSNTEPTEEFEDEQSDSEGEQTSRRKRPKEYYKVELIGVTSSISAVNKFMSLHPSFFKTNVSKKIIYVNEQLCALYTEPLFFRDNIHKVNGYITTTLENGVYAMQVYINKTNKNKECYIKQIESHVNYQTKYGNMIELNYYKILSDSIVKHCFYYESVEQWNKDTITVQNEFFSPHKKYLFSIINDKAKNNGIGNTANSWNNLILHGITGGMGKSSFVFRTAMMLKLSIISVDLKLFLNKKKDLYSLFHGQEFALPNNVVKEPAIPNAIIVLEEFDYAIDKLLDIENIFKYKDVIKKEYLNMKNNEIKSRTNELLEAYSKDEKVSDTSSYEKRMKEIEKMNQGEMDYDKFVEMEMLQDGFDTQNSRVFDKARNNVLFKRDFDNEICGINAELDNIIKSMDDDNKSNILRLSDMLELFQGPVPVKNRIIIATTNNFDKIKKECATLFRAGRLSPIHFDYLDWDSLNELCFYYFQKHMTCEPRKITISTSYIIELAIKYISIKKEFEEFQEELLLAL